MENENKEQTKPASDTFTDLMGNSYKPLFTTPVLMDICRKTNITLAKLIEMDINGADLLEALWCSCAIQAKQYKVTREIFFANIAPQDLPLAFRAFWSAIMRAFPTLEDMPLPPEIKQKVSFVLGMLGI